MYIGEVDWILIGEVKNNLCMYIFIIGNGDVIMVVGVKECFEWYGVDVIMIGCGSIGCFWIFCEVKYYLEIGEEFLWELFEWYFDVLCEEVLNSVVWLDECRGIIYICCYLVVIFLFKGIFNFCEICIVMLCIELVEEFFWIFDGFIIE